jgi:membrane protein DedA with SNARE-associated domain
MVLSLVVSTIVFFVAAYFIKRQLDEMDIPKGMTRSVTIFVLALAAAYGVAWVVDRIAGT